MSRIAPPQSQPVSLSDVEFLAGGVDEVELPLGVLPVQLLVTPERRRSIRANLDYGHLVQFAAISFGVGFQRIYDEPLIGVLLTDLRPTHLNLLMVIVAIWQPVYHFCTGRSTTRWKRRPDRFGKTCQV